MQQVREAAAAEGRELSAGEFREAVKALMDAREEPVAVANNPAIQFPTRREERVRRQARTRNGDAGAGEQRGTQGLKTHMKWMEEQDAKKGGKGGW